MKTLKDLLTDGLPTDFIGQRSGVVDIYRLGKALDLRPQSVHEWFRKNRIPVSGIEKLLRIGNSNLTLNDFRPFCTELDTVLRLIDEANDSGAVEGQGDDKY